MSKPHQELIVSPAAELNAAAARIHEDCRRRHARYETTKALVVVPVLPDGSLDWNSKSVGFSVNVSEGGMGLEVDCPAEELPRSLFVGVEDESGETQFTGVQVRYAKTDESGRSYVGAAFGGAGEELFDDGKLTPRFNPQTCAVEYPFPQDDLDRMARAGVLERKLCDRVLVCPHCRSLPTFREGCRKCSSARVDRDQLMHHYACAHVDLAKNFATPDGLMCPKCRTTRLVVGADFEYLHGEFLCQDCQWSDSSLEMIGHCLRCNQRFAAQAAVSADLYAYRAKRLDWRAMIDGPQQLTHDAETNRHDQA